MPRDSNGIYTLPASNPVVTDTVISTSWANPTLSDIGAEITNSLPRDGSAGMTGKLKLSDGSSAAPSLTFTTAATVGLFQDLSDPVTPSLGMSVAGSRKLLVSQYFIETASQVRTQGTVGSAQTIFVDSTGVAAPVNPLGGNPFNTLANALAFAATFSASNDAPLGVVLTSGQTFTITADIAIAHNVAIRASIAGTKATISGNFFLKFTGVSSLTDITLTQAKLNISGGGLTITNCGSTTALRTDKAINMTGGAELTITDALTVVLGSVALDASHIQSAAALTLSNGDLSVQSGSTLDITGALTLSLGDMAVNLSFAKVGAALLLSSGKLDLLSGSMLEALSSVALTLGAFVMSHSQCKVGSTLTLTDGKLDVVLGSTLEVVTNLLVGKGVTSILHNSYLDVLGTCTISNGAVIVTTILIIENMSGLRSVGNLSITASLAGVSALVRYGSNLNAFGTVSVTNTAAGSTGIFLDINSSCFFSGTGALTVNVLDTGLSCRGRSYIKVDTGKTFTLPGAGKTIFASTFGYMTLLSLATGSVYTPALGTTSTGGAIISQFGT